MFSLPSLSAKRSTSSSGTPVRKMRVEDRAHAGRPSRPRPMPLLLEPRDVLPVDFAAHHREVRGDTRKRHVGSAQARDAEPRDSGCSTGMAQATKPPQSWPTKIRAFDVERIQQPDQVSGQLGESRTRRPRAGALLPP